MDEFMRAAVVEARMGLAERGIPVGAVLVYGGRIIGRGRNRRVQRGSAILHGETDALENAGRQPAAVYRQCTLYTTLSPCAMCSGAILLFGIPKVIVGENRNFTGEEELLRSRGVAVAVLQDPECSGMMEDSSPPGRSCGTRISGDRFFTFASASASTGCTNYSEVKP